MSRTKINSSLLSAKKVRVFHSIDDIGKAAVDSIAQDPFFTYGLFKTLQSLQTYPTSPIYLAIYDESKIIGVAPLFIEATNANSTDSLTKFLNIGHRIGLWQNCVLNCYSPFSYRSKILLAPNQDEKLLLEILSKNIDSLCKNKRILISRFSFVSELDELLNENIHKYGYKKNAYPNDTTFYLDIKWTSFEDYLDSLKGKIKTNVRREIRKCKENGVTIEESKLDDLTIKVSELYTNLSLKYNKHANKIFDPDFFSTLNMYSKEKIKLFIAKKNGEVIGFSLTLLQRGVLDVMMVGFNYSMQTETDFSYFNLTFYTPIKWAIENGVEKIYYRWSMEKIKLDRGCKPEKTYSFTKYHNILLRALIRNLVNNPFFNYLRPRLSKLFV